MVRGLAYVVLILGGCATDAGSGGSATSERASAEDGGAASPSFCDGLSACCPLIRTTGEPGCTTVSGSGDETRCGLVLEALQDIQAPAGGILSSENQCGGSGNEAVVQPPPTAACVALNECCSRLADGGTASAACSAVVFPNDSFACASAISYFKSQGSCESVAFDAGTWAGLPPNIGAGGSGGDAVGSLSASSGGASR